MEYHTCAIAESERGLPVSGQVRHYRLNGRCKKMAKQLEGVEAECINFAAYLADSSDQEDWDVKALIRPVPNEQKRSAHPVLGRMLSSFIAALTEIGAIWKVKRIILVTGANKNRT